MPGSPQAKRIKLESSSPEPEPQHSAVQQDEDEEEHCSICLQPIVDRALIPKCSHEFCFECLTVWSEQSRRCPLCSQGIGEYVIHHIRSKYDYQKYFLAPLRTSPRPLQRPAESDTTRRPTRREREWGRRQRQDREEADQLQQSISKRRWVYSHHLYAMHVASNSFTRYRPFPTPAQFSASADYISRTTAFVRRELQVWPNLDVEFLTTFIISIMKSIDIRAESAVKLLSEFLDMDEPYVEGQRHPNAEHFAHELYSFLRSPYRDLYIYDSVVQYETPDAIQPPPIEFERSKRWRSLSKSRSRSPGNRSPSPRIPSTRDQRRTSRERNQASGSRRRSPSRSRSRDRYEPRREKDSRRKGRKSPSRSRSVSRHNSERQPVNKGKGKARDLSLEIKEGSSERRRYADNVMDIDYEIPRPFGQELARENGAGPSISNSERARDLKPVRGGRERTLLESVQSHLSLDGKPAANGSELNTKPPERPSLLSRLTEPKIVDEDVSNPDVMARTRARVAALRNEPIAGVEPSNSSPPPLSASPTPEAPNVNVLRNKLLDRLDAERNHALLPVAVEEGTAGAADSDSLKAESRLRTKAQVRVRLAAAKRAHEEKQTGKETGVEHAQREEALRAKLKGGRRTVD